MPRIPCRAALAVAFVFAAMSASPARAQNLARTPTIYVHGFEESGADRHGVFGVELRVPQMDSIAAMAGLPAADSGAVTLPPDVVTATTYYGDAAPAYYTAADLAALNAATAQWGGGVPRYAEIVARYIRDVMRRSGATRVNVVSASLGTLIVRWMIEKDAAGLAGEGRIARWMTIEGLLAGNWAASRSELVSILDTFQPQPIDVAHMHYDWVTAHLHAPRTEADDPKYAAIRIGQIVSTGDGYNQAALSNLMRAYGEFSPNDGVQAVADAHFSTMTARSRHRDRVPTLSWFPSDHLSIKNHRGAWAAVASFITQRRRVTVTMRSARVNDLHEPQLPFWDLRPAEVLLQSRVTSPRVAARWGIGDAQSTREKPGAAAPLVSFDVNGQSKDVGLVLFDDFVLDDETTLRLDLHAEEVDYDWRYGVYETTSAPYYDEMGAGTLNVSAVAPGTYAFAAGDWSAVIDVAMTDYPAAEPTSVPGVSIRAGAALRVAPNPHASGAIVRIEGAVAAAGDWTLEVFDTGGRRVRRLTGDAAAGIRWDGRDARGALLPAGVYLHRLHRGGVTWQGRSLLVR